MSRKVVLVAFQGEPMCFVHVLLNALDMQQKGFDIKIIIEGAATRLVKELAEPDKPFANLYTQVKEAGLIVAVCKACAAKMGVLEDAQKQDLPIAGEMSGHPALAPYIEQDFEIITF